MPLSNVDEIVGYANGDGTFSIELHTWIMKDGEKVPTLMKIPKAEVKVTVLATVDNELWSIKYETHK